jgi:hypothetical protein
MIDILTQKLLTSLEQDIWNSDDSENTNLLISPKKDIVIEWTDTGYFEIQKSKVTFNNCVTGHTYCLRKNGTIDEWVKFQKWYLQGFNSKLYRTDVPISRDETEINGEQWDCTRWMRPGIGIGELNPHRALSDVTAVPDFLNSIIDIYYEAIASALNIGRDYDPTDVRIPDITFRHLLSDSTGYYFVKNFDTWDQNPEKIITLCIGLAQLVMKDFGPAISEEFYNEWTDKATQKWMSLL